MKKRILAMLLALSLVFVFTACGKNSAKAEKTLEKFFGEFTEGKVDLKNADSYVTDEDLKEDLFDSIDVDGFVENTDLSAFESMGITIDDDSVRSAAETFRKKAIVLYSFQTEEVKDNDDGTVTAKISVTKPDMENIEDETAIAEAAFSEVFGFDMSKPEEMLTKWAEKEGVTVEELLMKYITLPEEEISKAFAGAFREDLMKFIPALFDKLAEHIEESEKITTTYSCKMEEKDGNWVITDSEEIED